MARLAKNALAVSDPLSWHFARRKQIFILPLTFEDITAAVEDLERISYGGDIWELRVDLLKDPTDSRSSQLPSKEYVAAQLRFLKQVSSLPIIFTIRTISQKGKFPDDATKEAMDLMIMAIEQECEYINVECTWPPHFIDTVAKKKRGSKIVASYHDWTGQNTWTSIWRSKLPTLGRYGDILQLSPLLTDPMDCHRIALDMHEYQQQNSKPIILAGMGSHEQLSQIVSPISFVTHPLLPHLSGPSQLTLAQVHQCQHQIGYLPRKSFFIFGNRISHSLSPTIHNAAFAELGLPHHYSIYQTPQIDDQVRGVLWRPDFGGASVTFPHKLQIQPLLDSQSDAATKIGAVNTVIVEESSSGRLLRGDNTDWIGILNLMRRNSMKLQGDAIVVGAGGAARAAVFALQTFGWREISVVNRTRERAEDLISTFPTLTLKIFSSLSEAPPASVIIACIPADGILEVDIPHGIFDDCPGLVIEMSYSPMVSALMQVARKKGWVVYGGVDVLKEQAYAQFEMWTGRRAPVQAIEEALIT